VSESRELEIVAVKSTLLHRGGHLQPDKFLPDALSKYFNTKLGTSINTASNDATHLISSNSLLISITTRNMGQNPH